MCLVAASKFIRYVPFRCIVTIDGQETSFEALDVLIASGGYQGGVLRAPEARPDDGKIVIRILKGPSKWALAKKWARMSLGVPFGPDDIEVLRVPELTIDTVPKQHVAVDGEVIAQTPIRVSVAREALLLMVPRGFGESRESSSLGLTDNVAGPHRTSTRGGGNSAEELAPRDRRGRGCPCALLRPSLLDVPRRLHAYAGGRVAIDRRKARLK